jgi:hypothetical protein
MAHDVVNLKTRNDGYSIKKADQVWCLVVTACGDAATFCTGEFFGSHQGGADGDTKTVQRGGITCPDCLEKIKMIKAVML